MKAVLLLRPIESTQTSYVCVSFSLLFLIYLLLQLQFGLFFPDLALCLPLVIFENQGSIVAVLGVRNELVSLHDTLLDELVQGKTIDSVILRLGKLMTLHVALSPVVAPVFGFDDFLGIERLGLEILVVETHFFHVICF
jgi:hypothetical protein